MALEKIVKPFNPSIFHCFLIETESDEEFEEEIKDLPMIEREQRTAQRLERLIFYWKVSKLTLTFSKEKEARRQQILDKGPGKTQASLLNSLQVKFFLNEVKYSWKK